MGGEVYSATLAASLISILLNVALVRCVPASLHRWRLAKQTAVQSEQDLSGDELCGHVVLCGFGPVGSAIGAALEAFRIPYVVIEINPDIKSMLKGRGIPSVFGNAAHLDIPHRAGAEKASLAIITIPDIDRSRLAVARLHRLNLNVPILGRAHRTSDHASLAEAGANEAVQPEMEAWTTSPQDSRAVPESSRTKNPEHSIIDGSAHAQFLFQTDLAERVMREILYFLPRSEPSRV